MEYTASGKSKDGVESNLKTTVTYRPHQMKKSTSCLGGCAERRRRSAVSSSIMFLNFVTLFNLHSLDFEIFMHILIAFNY